MLVKRSFADFEQVFIYWGGQIQKKATAIYFCDYSIHVCELQTTINKIVVWRYKIDKLLVFTNVKIPFPLTILSRVEWIKIEKDCTTWLVDINI